MNDQMNEKFHHQIKNFIILKQNYDLDDDEKEKMNLKILFEAPK